MEQADGLLDTRARAAQEAAAELGVLGFVKDETGIWRRGGTAASANQGLTVKLPGDFPYRLPEVFADRSKLPRRIPHVESTGKVCIGINGQILIDISDARVVIRDAVARAERIITKGLSGELDADFHAEFLAYWEADVSQSVAWAGAVPSESTPLHFATLEVGKSDFCRWLVGSDGDALRAWAKRVGKDAKSIGKAFFLPLKQPFMPPDFDERITIGACLELLKRCSDGLDFDRLYEWLATDRTPSFVIVSLPAADGNGVILIGIVLPASKTLDLRPKSRRPRNASEDIAERLADRIEHLAVKRLDPDFIVTRGGASERLRNSVISIVGCGALGSHVAPLLAQAGVGTLRLIDDELLGPENLHRHWLGTQHLNSQKAEGIAAELRMSFPNLVVETRAKSVEDLLRDEAAFLLSSSAILVATGDETLELRLNEVLAKGPPRVFSWVEALGIGGHALSAGNGRNRGCLRCIYEPINGVRLGNTAAFVRHGQEVGRSFAGCAGRFTPFSALDAVRTATEAARLIIASVTDGSNNVLVSWYGNPQAVVEAGFLLSDRAGGFTPGQTVRIELPQAGCCVCG